MIVSEDRIGPPVGVSSAVRTEYVTAFANRATSSLGGAYAPAAPSEDGFHKHRSRNAERVRREVSWIEPAPEDEVTRTRRAERVEPRRVIQLADLDRRADRVRDGSADGQSRARRERPDPPGDHRGPECVARHIARDRIQPHAAQGNEKAYRDRA